MTGHVYAVASGKGGVGKTTTVVNLGVMLRAEGHSVALVDADLGMPNLAGMLGIDHEPTLHDVLADEATVEAAINEESDGFGIVQGTHELTGFAIADPAELKTVVETLADRYEYVLLDTGPGLSHEDVLPLGIADKVVLVTTPSEISVGDVGKTNELVDIVDGDTAGVVVTHADQATDPEAIGERLGTTVLGVIPEDTVVPESIRAGQPLEAFDPDSRAAAAYRRLAARLIEANAPNVDALDIDDLEPQEPTDTTASARPDTDRDRTDEPPESAPSDGADTEVSDEEVETTADERTMATEEREDATDEPSPFEGIESEDPDDSDSRKLDTASRETENGADGDQPTSEQSATPEEATPTESVTTTASDDRVEASTASERVAATGTDTAAEETTDDGETGEGEDDTDDEEGKTGRGGVLGWFSRRLS